LVENITKPAHQPLSDSEVIEEIKEIEVEKDEDDVTAVPHVNPRVSRPPAGTPAAMLANIMQSGAKKGGAKKGNPLFGGMGMANLRAGLKKTKRNEKKEKEEEEEEKPQTDFRSVLRKTSSRN